ncbi:MAG: DUF2178 domain-containing protein [Patescibacteria group bacterium]|jgi:uncharacterized membrane protein
MTAKQYKVCRLAIIIVLAMSISISISLENYYLPIVFLLSSSAGMYYCRKQLKTEKIMVDERDYQVAGNAARYTIFIYGWIGAILTFILMAISEQESLLYTLSQYLAFSVCFLMLLNAFLFKYLSKRAK